jgi:hypothetical protein
MPVLVQAQPHDQQDAGGQASRSDGPGRDSLSDCVRDASCDNAACPDQEGGQYEPGASPIRRLDASHPGGATGNGARPAQPSIRKLTPRRWRCVVEQKRASQGRPDHRSGR